MNEPLKDPAIQEAIDALSQENSDLILRYYVEIEEEEEDAVVPIHIIQIGCTWKDTEGEKYGSYLEIKAYAFLKNPQRCIDEARRCLKKNQQAPKDDE